MAWVSPRTYTAAAVLTAAQLNETRDSLKAIGDVWTTYTPAWTSTGVAPALGNGTLTGSYILAGKLVTFQAILTAGSTSTYGTGSYRISLPVASASAGNVPYGTATIIDTSASATYIGSVVLTGATTTVGVFHQSAAGASAALAQTSPMTWATGDNLSISGTYQAA